MLTGILLEEDRSAAKSVDDSVNLDPGMKQCAVKGDRSTSWHVIAAVAAAADDIISFACGWRV